MPNEASVEFAGKAFAAAEKWLSDCNVQLRTVAAAEELADDYMKEDFLEAEGEQLARDIERLYRATVMVLETLGQQQNLNDLRAAFEPLRPKLAKAQFFQGDQDLPYNDGIDLLSSWIFTLAPLFAEPEPLEVRREVLSTMLQQTNVLMGRTTPPKREKDIQDQLETMLILAFPDTIREAAIPKQTKSYHPDFGIPSIGTAVEVKFVSKREDVGKAMGGLYEDMHGYEGAYEWSYFIAVVYMTGPYVSQRRLQAEAEKANIPKSWEVHTVVGPGHH